MSDNMDKTKAEEILGLTGQYTATDLRNAYAKCAKDYHPDAQGLNEAAKEIAQDYMTEINVAHTYLRKKFKEYPNIKTFTAGVEPGYTSSFDAAAASYSAAYNKKNNNNANNYNSTSTQQATTQNTNNTNNSYSASSFSQTNNYQTRDRQNQTYHQAQQDQTQRQSQTQSQTTTQNPNPADVEEAHDAATDAFRKAMFTYGSSVYIPPDPKNKKTNSDSVKADASNVSDPNSTYYGYSAASSASTAGTTQSTDSQTVSDVLQEPPKTRKGLIKSYHYAEKVIDHFPVSLILGIICLFITLTYWSGGDPIGMLLGNTKAIDLQLPESAIVFFSMCGVSCCLFFFWVITPIGRIILSYPVRFVCFFIDLFRDIAFGKKTKTIGVDNSSKQSE